MSGADLLTNYIARKLLPPKNEYKQVALSYTFFIAECYLL